MKLMKHHLATLILLGTAPIVGAFDLHVDTEDIAAPANTLDVYNLLPGDAGHGADGPGDKNGNAVLARSGVYECDQDTLENFAGPEEVIADNGVNPGGKLDLVEAIRLASSCLANRGNTIHLQEDGIYQLDEADNFWFGPNALPPVRGTLTIIGNGATIERSGADPMRFLANFGNLTLRNLSLKGGWARGGDGGDGVAAGGGGAGLGGAIYNRGGLELVGVTLEGNTAEGGGAGDNSVGSPANGAGGGLGGDAVALTGGGFFGTEFLGGEAGADTQGGTSPALFGCSGLTTEECELRAEGGLGGGASGGGGGAFGGGGTQANGTSDPGGGLGGGFSASNDPGENGGGWLVDASISGGAGGIGGGGGPGATGGFGGGSGGGQTEAAFGGGAQNQGGAAYGGAVFNHGGAVRIQNSTFSGNAAIAGVDADGVGQSNRVEAAGVYSLNSQSTPGANQWEFNTFYLNTCDADGDCNGASAAIQLAYGPGIERHPGTEEEGSGNYIKEEVESNYTLFGNILDTQSGGEPLLIRVDEPGATIDDEKLKFQLNGANNLVPVGKVVQQENQVGVVSDAVWNSCVDDGAVDSQVLVLCGPAPKEASGGINLAALGDNGGYTLTHMPNQDYLADQVIFDLIRGLNVDRDQRGAKRECISNDPQVQIGAVERDFCNTAPRLNVPTSLLLNEAAYTFDAFGVEDDRLASDTLTLVMNLTNIASIDLPDDLDGVVASSGNTVIEGRRANLERVMESAGFTVDDMTQATAEIVFTLENGAKPGLTAVKTLTVDLDIKPPEPDVTDLPSLVTSQEAFTVTVTVDEPVGGVDVAKVQIIHGEAVGVANVSPTEYELTLSANGGPDGQQPLFFQFLPGAVIDNAGNDSERSAEPYRIPVNIPDDEEDLDGRSGGGGGSAALGPLALILLLAGALRFRRNGL